MTVRSFALVQKENEQLKKQTSQTEDASKRATDAEAALAKAQQELALLRQSAEQSAAEAAAHCKMGGRSAKAVDFLRQAGFAKVKNLKGGILAWADRVDPTMPKY